MNSTDPANQDLFLFSDEGSPGGVEDALPAPARRIWSVMVIDDDADVHRATQFALEGSVLFDRRIELVHAHSAAQARDLLLTHGNIALVLLDVVMETHDAGLQLVDFIRNVAGHRATRIVLRTGQPGYAPELDTLLQYDINDYKTKSELTHHKLITTVAAALRSYDQLCTIEAGRRGLELIVQASGSFLEPQGLSNFAAGVITQMAAILGVQPEGLVCAQGERGGGGGADTASTGGSPNVSLSGIAANGLLQMALVLFVTFFLYRDGAAISNALYVGARKLGGELGENMLDKARGTVVGVMLGIVGTAAAQGTVAMLGFLIAGVPQAMLLGFATFFLSMIPVGPPLIWGGAAAWLYSEGQTGWAIFMVLYGLFVISSIDNFVKPILIARGAGLSILLIALGVLGGVLVFGFIGIFLGPVLLALGHMLFGRWTREDIPA